MTDKEIFCVPLQGIICSVQTFAFDKLTTKIKERLMILEDVGNLWTVNLKAYDNNNPRMPPPVFSLATKIDFLNNGNRGSKSTSKPNTGACNKFIATAVKKESAYVAAVQKNKWQRSHEMAQQTVTLIRMAKFPLTGFCLDMLYPLLLKPKVANEIGIPYGRLPIKAKIKFYVDQMKVEIKPLDIFILQKCNQVSNLEGEIKYVEILEAQCAKQIRILKSVRKRDRELQKEIRSWKAILDKPLEDPNGYESDMDFELGRVHGGNTGSPLNIDNACPPLLSARTATGLSGEAVAALSNSAFGSVDPGLEDIQPNKMYKEFMNAE